MVYKQVDKCDGQAYRLPMHRMLSHIPPHVAASDEVCGKIIIILRSDEF